MTTNSATKIYLCVNCSKEAPEYHNYCSWDCSIDLAKKNGGLVHTPNGLPIMSIKANNNMFETEHGDHPDYIFPVEMERTDKDPNDKRDIVWVDDKGNECSQSETNTFECRSNEEHALIYTDGCICLTLYECCYATWRLRDGSLIGGALWQKPWRMTQESIDKVKQYHLGMSIAMSDEYADEIIDNLMNDIELIK